MLYKCDVHVTEVKQKELNIKANPLQITNWSRYDSSRTQSYMFTPSKIIKRWVGLQCVFFSPQTSSYMYLRYMDIAVFFAPTPWTDPYTFHYTYIKMSVCLSTCQMLWVTLYLQKGWQNNLNNTEPTSGNPTCRLTFQKGIIHHCCQLRQMCAFIKNISYPQPP